MSKPYTKIAQQLKDNVYSNDELLRNDIFTTAIGQGWLLTEREVNKVVKLLDNKDNDLLID